MMHSALPHQHTAVVYKRHRNTIARVTHREDEDVVREGWDAQRFEAWDRSCKAVNTTQLQVTTDYAKARPCWCPSLTRWHTHDGLHGLCKH
jgi:hypothetical protein